MSRKWWKCRGQRGCNNNESGRLLLTLIIVNAISNEQNPFCFIAPLTLSKCTQEGEAVVGPLGTRVWFQFETLEKGTWNFDGSIYHKYNFISKYCTSYYLYTKLYLQEIAALLEKPRELLLNSLHLDLKYVQCQLNVICLFLSFNFTFYALL